MRMKKCYAAVVTLLLIILTALFVGCGKNKMAKDSGRILLRIPGESEMAVSFKPVDIYNSKFSHKGIIN